MFFGGLRHDFFLIARNTKSEALPAVMILSRPRRLDGRLWIQKSLNAMALSPVNVYEAFTKVWSIASGRNRDSSKGRGLGDHLQVHPKRCRRFVLGVTVLYVVAKQIPGAKTTIYLSSIPSFLKKIRILASWFLVLSSTRASRRFTLITC